MKRTIDIGSIENDQKVKRGTSDFLIQSESGNSDKTSTKKEPCGIIILNFSIPEDEDIDIESSTLYIRGLPWQISVQNDEVEGKQYLGIYVYCNKGNISSIWSCDASIEFEIKSKNKDNCLTERFRKHFTRKITGGWGIKKFVELSDLMNLEKGYQNSDQKFTVEARIYINELNGYRDTRLSPIDVRNDVINIGGQVLIVNKFMLAAHSPFFHKLLFSSSFKEGQEGRFELRDPNDDVDAFKAMLDIIDASSDISQRTPITLENVEKILDLADKYDVYSARKKCENFLLEVMNTDMLLFKQSLADKFEMPILEDHCIKEITSKSLLEFSAMRYKSKSDYDRISDRSKTLILDQFSDLLKVIKK